MFSCMHTLFFLENRWTIRVAEHEAHACSSSSKAVAARTEGDGKLVSRDRERRSVDGVIRLTDIACKLAGISSRKRSMAQSVDRQVESDNLLKWSGTICRPALAELWKNDMFLRFTEANKD